MDAPQVPPDSNESDTFSDPRRRSPRVVHRVPLLATFGKSTVSLESIIVNEHGALVESTYPFQAGAAVTIRNEKLARQIEAWVIWAAPGDTPGAFDVGIEFATSDPAFWGLLNRGLRAQTNEV
jgi:hypothetical protein